MTGGGGGDGGVFTDDKQDTGHYQHDSEDPPINNKTTTTTSQPDTSRKRAGSPINDFQYDGLKSEIRPLKRINTDNPPHDEGHNSGTLLLLGGDSAALAPPDHNFGQTATSSLSPALTSYSSSSTLPCDFTHLATVVDKRDDEGGCPPPRLVGEGEPSSTSNDPGHLGTFEHQASIYPTPQTGEFVEQAAFELPPLRPKASQGDEQATQVTLPHFNEIYGSIDTALPLSGASQPSLSVFNAPTASHSVRPVYSQREDAHHQYEQDIPVLQPVDGTAQDQSQLQEQQYQQQLPLPHQPFLPTPDRMEAIRAQQLKHQQQQDDEYMARHHLYQQSAESQYSHAYQAFLAGQCLPPAVVEQRPADSYIMHEGQTTRCDFAQRPYIVGYPQDAFRRPSIAPSYYPHPYEGTASSSTGHNYGLGITNMARPPSQPQQSYGHEQTQPALGRPTSASIPQPSAERFGGPDFRAFYEQQQHKMHVQRQQQQQHQEQQAQANSSASEAAKIFRPAHFPPETYASASVSQQRQSATHIHNQGAGATLAKAPSFTSPPIHHREGPPRLPFTPSMIPSKLHNPYAAFSPGGRPQISVAQQIVDRIDLPTLHHALRYWKSVLSDPKTHPDLKTTSAMNCHVLEKRIRVVTSAMQEQQSRIFGGAPPALGTGVIPSASVAIESPSRPMTAPPRPECSAARARTHSSDAMINTTPMPAVPSLLMRRTASSSVSSSTSPVRSKVTTPKATATPKNPKDTPAEANSISDKPKTSPRLTVSEMASKASASRSKSPVSTRKPAAASASIAPSKRSRKPGSANTKADKGKSAANASDLKPTGASSAIPVSTSTGVAGPMDIAVPAANATGAAASAQEAAAGTNSKQDAKATSSGKKKSESPASAAPMDPAAHKSGDLIFESEWPKDDSHSAPLKVELGPQLLSDVTYTWSEQECAKERRLMHVTAVMNLQERSTVIKVEPLASQDYSDILDKAPYVQGAVVSCIFAEIFSKEPGEEPPIYWLSYWDVLKVCEVSLDLSHRTLHFRRGQELKGRLLANVEQRMKYSRCSEQLGWVDVRKLGSPAGIALSTKMTKYTAPRPLENPRLNLKIMPWNELHYVLEALAQRLAGQFVCILLPMEADTSPITAYSCVIYTPKVA